MSDEKIIACLRDDFRLNITRLVFLPIGADVNTAVYRAIADDESAYFAKLRSGIFDETAITLPKFLTELGIQEIIAPLLTKTAQLFTTVDSFKLILYPFVDGRNGYETDLADHHWRELGSALKRIHSAEIPSTVANHIQRETFSPQWRESVKKSLGRIETDTFDDPIATDLADFIKVKRAEISRLVEHTEQLAQALIAHSPHFVLCHSDIHAGNVLIDSNDRLCIIDWDNPIFAPKERDLMYAGGAQFGSKRTPQAEEKLFYEGYGPTEIDPIAMAYYRYERIIDDIAVECEAIFSTTMNDADRAQELIYLKSNFLPNNTLAIAYHAEENQR
ncbi:MAG: phosphotransferase [Chloroflexi bacterium]|nr:phosphotransferase [Chloroflexota bacterium]